VQVRIIFTIAGRTFSNVVHGMSPSGQGATDANAQALMSGFSTQFTSSGWAGFVHPTVDLFQVGLKSLHTANQVEHFSTGAGVPGSAAGAGAPMSAALVVTLRTANAGRAFRGRVYLGGMADTALQNMLDTSTAANTAAAAFVTGMMATMQSATMPMGIAQRQLNAGTDHSGAALPARAANIIPVTLAEVHNPRVDSQRRRLGK
jgi:hypothetical protein